MIILAGFGGALIVGRGIGRRAFDSPSTAGRALLPWLVVFLAMALAALLTFNLPMEMRGGILPAG
jgi:hypothetical protein